MIARNSGGERPGLKSTAMPRRRKISTAAGESLSEMRTLGTALLLRCLRGCVLGFDLRQGPVEPGQEGFDVGGLDGGAAPDAKAGRRIAIGAGVECDAFLLQNAGEPLRSGSLAFGVERCEPGSDQLQADGGAGA